MSQAGFTPIKLYSSTTPTVTPTAGNLEQGELAINTADGKLFYEDSSGVVQVLATKDAAAGNFTTLDATNLEVTNLKAKDGTAAGSIANSTGIVTLASSVLTTADINGGTIDATSIGATTPSTVVATQVDITAQGDLRLQDTTGGQFVALQAPSTIATSYTLTLPVDDGTAGQALITDGSGVLSWSTAASGDVYGPASATDNAIVRFDGTTGKIVQNSVVTIADDGATVIAANSASAGLQITQTGAGNAILVEDSANPDASPFVIDHDGVVGIGSTTPQSTFSLLAGLGSQSSTSFAPQVVQRNKTNDTSAPYFISQKDRAGAIVQSGDTIGNIVFQAYDGAAYLNSAIISAAVDGTPALNDMPGRLVFSTTPDGASNTTERMRIANSGVISLGAAPGSESLRVTPVASAVNYLQVAGGATGNAATMSAAGTDTNVPIAFVSKGTGDIRFTTNASERVRVTSSGNVGIGTATPTLPLTIGNSTLPVGATIAGQMISSDVAATTPLLNLRRSAASGNPGLAQFTSSGTEAVPTAVALNRNLGRNDWWGFDGANYSNAVAITAAVDGVVSAGVVPGRLVFSTAITNTPIERMRITSSGSLCLGLTTPVLASKSSINWDASTEQGITLKSTSATFTASPIIFINNADALSGSIGQSASTISYNTSSDYRLKENVLPMTGALAKVAALKPVTYTWKVDGSAGQGFIAHELQEIVPDCVTGEKDAVDKDGKPWHQGVDTSFLVATLTAAIQEQQVIISAMEARLAALEA